MTRASELAGHYTRFGVAGRLLLTGHSHQAWPDVALDGQIEAFTDASAEVDRKWAKASAMADRVRAGFACLLGVSADEIALGSNTHELVIRFLSALDLRARPRLVTTDGEFHTLRRQLARLGELDSIEVVRVPSAPVHTLADRLSARVDERTAAVFVSSVLFETSRIVPALAGLARATVRHGAELLVDAYHQLGVVPLSLTHDGVGSAWVVGGGYKYLQLGEGNCFLRLPEHASRLRPVITGWFAEFDELAGERGDGVSYGPGPHRFAGSTYDPTSHYRAARVFDFFAAHGLTPGVLREISKHQRSVLTRRFDALGLPDEVITRDRVTPPESFAGFVSLRSPRAAEFQARLADRGVLTDSRGPWLRFGPAPYLTDDQLVRAMDTLGEVID